MAVKVVNTKSIHNTRNAKASVGRIRGSKPGRRSAFAVGKLGSFPVMLVRGQQWSSIENAIKKMAFDPKDLPDGVSAISKYRPHTRGLLFRDGESLILECVKRPNPEFLKSVNKYFAELKAGRPLKALTIRKLDENDPGDTEPDDNDVEVEVEVEVEEGPALPTEVVFDDAVWDEDQDTVDDSETTVVADDDVDSDTTLLDDRDGNFGPAGAKVEGSTHETPMTQTQAAQRSVQRALQIAPMLQLDLGDVKDQLPQIFENLLETISSERLLLALCVSSDVRDLVDVAAQARLSPPIEHTKSGIEEIADAIASMGTRIARAKHYLIDGEIGRSANIKGTVTRYWDTHPQMSAEDIILDVTDVLAQTFASLGREQMRKLLDLPPKPPAAPQLEDGEPAARGSDALEASMGALASIRAGWSRERQAAQQGIKELSDALFNELKDDETQVAALAAAVTRVNGLIPLLDERLETMLDAVLNALDTEHRKTLIAAARANMERMAQFISSDELMAAIDGNAIIPSMVIVEPLQARMAEMRAVLADA